VASISQFHYPRAACPALANLDVNIRPGDFVGVTGPAGAGRTTLCYCLTGVIPHALQGTFEGSVQVMGVNLADQPLPQLAGLVGLVLPQPENQLFNLTVEEDVAFGPENLGLNAASIRARVDQSLDFVGMRAFRHRASSTLSGGEMQRTVLASVLAMTPELLVLDQPASALDPLGRQQIYDNLFRLNRERGTTIVVVEDRLDDVLVHASRIFLMQAGQIIVDTSPAQFLSDKRVLASGIRLPVLMQPNHRFATTLSSPASCPTAEIERVHIAKVSFRYPKTDHWTLEEVSLSFRAGESVAIVGSNGAGKTTLAKHLIGLLRPTRGKVTVEGQDTARLSTARLSGKVGFLFQDPDYQIFANSVFDEVAFGLKIRKVPNAEITQRVSAILDRLGLLAFADNHPYRLSRGQRQRLALATILVREPSILVVDEPSSGLDYAETLDVMGLLNDFREQGGTVILITHDMELVERFATRVVVMANGKIKADMPTSELAVQTGSLPKDCSTALSFVAPSSS
jgi:energy-coupling factor transport system ATP-binding protein